MTSGDLVTTEVALMASKRGVGREDGHLLLLPDNKKSTTLVERFMFWHVAWKRLKSLGWIIDTNAHGRHEFIVIPPLTHDGNSMVVNVDFFSDEKMLINSLADDRRFATEKELVSLRKEYDEFVVQFKLLKDMVIQHQNGNVFATQRFPRAILTSNQRMLVYLQQLVVQQATRNTLKHAEEQLRTEMARRELNMERDLKLKKQQRIIAEQELMKNQRENMQRIIAEQELMKSELQRRVEEDRRLLDEEIRATRKKQVDAILSCDLQQQYTEPVPSSVPSQPMMTRNYQPSGTQMSPQLMQVLEPPPAPPLLPRPQLASSSFLPPSQRLEPGNKSYNQSTIGAQTPIPTAGTLAKTFREAQTLIPTAPMSNSKLQSISVLSPFSCEADCELIKNKLAEALLHVQAIQARGAAAANRFRLPVPSESNQFVALKNDAKGCTITRSEMEGACRDLNMDRLRSELFGTLQNIELKENTTILQGSGKNNCSSLPVTDRSNQFVAAKDHFKITPNEIVGAHRDLNTNPLRTKPFGTRQSIELPEKMKILQGMGNGIHVAVPHGLIPARKRPRLC